MSPPSMPASMTYTQEILRKTVTKICQDIGWHRSHVSCLDVLSDMLGVYLHRLSQACADYASHSGRTVATIEDVQLAFEFMNIEHGQLLDFVTSVESSPLDNIPIPFYPIAKLGQNRVFNHVEEDEERAEWYYPWLPSLDASKASDLKSRLEMIAKASNVEKEETLANLNENSTDNSLSSNGKAAVEPVKATTDNNDNKLVLKVNFSKSLDEKNGENSSLNGNNKGGDAQLESKNKSLNMLQRFQSSRAFEEFLSSSLIRNPAQARDETIAADRDRLPICPLSPSMSQEPDSPSNSNMAPGNHDTTIKEADLKFSKKFKKRCIHHQFDFFDDDDDVLSFNRPQHRATNIKVKEPGAPKSKAKKQKDETLKPFSIKVTGFGLSGLGENEPGENLLNIPILTDDGSNIKTVQRKTKTQREKTTAPKEKKAKKTSKTSKAKASEEKVVTKLNLMPPSLFDEDEAAKTLMSMSASNDGVPTLKVTNDPEGSNPMMERSFNDSFDDSMGKSLDEPSNQSMIDNKPSTPASKKSTNTTASTSKRNKGIYTKKIVKSAEVVESSDESSSSGEDKPALPLLPPSESTNVGEHQATSSKKRKHSSDSSLSLLASPHEGGNTINQDGEESAKKKHKKKKKKKDKHHRSSEEKAERKKLKKEKKKKKEREKLEKEKGLQTKLKINLKYSDVSMPSTMGAEVADPTAGPSTSAGLSEPKPKKMKLSKKSDEVGDGHDSSLVIAKEKPEKTKPKTPSIKLAAQPPALDDLFKSDGVIISKKTKKKRSESPEKKIKEKMHIDIASSDKMKDDEKKKIKDKMAKVDKEKEKKKDKHQQHLSQQDTKSCKLYRETIGEKSFAEQAEKDWECPICKSGHLECNALGCDNCDRWYHYTCLGIVTGPAENETWYCPKCAKSKQRSSKSDKKTKTKKDKHTSKLAVVLADVGETSPAMLSPDSGRMYVPKTPGYVPTGRPRGRPRKDSGRSESDIRSPTMFDLSPSILAQGTSKICTKCDLPDEGLPMLACETCGRWAHRFCVDVNNTQPVTIWYCGPSCRRDTAEGKVKSKHDHKALSLTDSKFLVATGGGGGASTSSKNKMKQAKLISQVEEDSEVLDSEKCAVCLKASNDNDDVEWIACDECSRWYHFVCVNLTRSPPEDEPWFCNDCIQKQVNIAQKFKKMKKLRE